MGLIWKALPKPIRIATHPVGYAKGTVENKIVRAMRPKRRKGSNGLDGSAIGPIIGAILLIGLLIYYWYVTLGAVGALAASYLVIRGQSRIKKRSDVLGLGLLFGFGTVSWWTEIPSHHTWWFWLGAVSFMVWTLLAVVDWAGRIIGARAAARPQVIRREQRPRI